MSNKLTEFQQKAVDIFSSRPDTDVSIRDIHRILYDYADGVKVRHMQQRLAPLFHRINNKSEGYKIEPGMLKRTYRMNTTNTR